MFKKALHDLKTSAPLKTSDRRKLRQRVLEQFAIDTALPGNDGVGDLLVPEGILTAKFSTHLDEHGVVYLDPAPPSDPLWFTLGKGPSASVLVPSVYTLWKRPSLLPSVSTPEAVIPKLVGGADLMARGVITCPRDIAKDQLVSITEYGTKCAPLGVGYMFIPSNSLSEATTGKAVIVLHMCGDELWSMGGKTEAPIIEESVLETEAVVEGDISVGNPSEGLEPPENQPALEKPLELTPDEVGGILRKSLIQAILTTNPSAYPLAASQFYSAYILPARPSHNPSNTPIDIKHSPFKNLTQFLKHASQDGLLRIKEQKGDLTVLSVDKSHPDVASFSLHRTLADEAEKDAKREAREAKQNETSNELVVQELWKGVGSRHLTQFFKELNKDPASIYSYQDLRMLVNEYVTANSLAALSNQAMVRLDALLHATIGSANENIDQLRREDIVQRLCSKMQPWHSIGRGGQETPRKGVLSPITIATKQRQGRKIVTCITGFESFDIDAVELGEELKIKCAGSTAVTPLPGKLAIFSEVMVQGSHVDIVREVLESKGVNKKWITVDTSSNRKK